LILSASDLITLNWMDYCLSPFLMESSSQENPTQIYLITIISYTILTKSS